MCHIFLQEKYQREQEKLREEWQRAKQEAERENSKYLDEVVLEHACIVFLLFTLLVRLAEKQETFPFSPPLTICSPM